MALEVVEAEPTLDELAAALHHEHQEVMGSLRSALTHAIRAGEILLAVQAQTGDKWVDWVGEHFDGSRGAANAYVRIATYQDRLPDRSIGVRQALGLLRGLPNTGQTTRPTWAYGDELRRSVRALSKDGKTGQEIAATLGIGASTVSRWLNPEKDKRDRERTTAWKRRRKQAHAALEREERAKAAKRRGGSVSHAWAYVAKAAQALDHASTQASSPEERIYLETALRRLHIVEDDIGKALRC